MKQIKLLISRPIRLSKVSEEIRKLRGMLHRWWPFIIKRRISRLKIQQNFHKLKRMSRRDNHTSLSEFPSLFSSSGLIDDLSIRNDQSLRFINNDQNIYGLVSLDDLKIEEFSIKRRISEDHVGLELKRCTSFQEILMENHRTVLVDSMKEYFARVQHKHAGRYQMKDIKRKRLEQAELEQEIHKKEEEIQRIINLHHSELLQKEQFFNKCRENPDQIHTIFDVMNICPQQLEFEVLYLISHIFAECNQIIQHFKRKNLSKELKNRSLLMAQELRKDQCLNKLFEECSEKKVGGAFDMLVQKWMITLFLMKVGVFENELETKSIDECLKSDIFREISLNDILNQHLIKPNKKIKQE